MQKIVYKITKNDKERTFIKGIGYVNDNFDIICSQELNGKQRTIIFYGDAKECHKRIGHPNEFVGNVSYFAKCNNFEGCREVDYNIWFKVIGGVK